MFELVFVCGITALLLTHVASAVHLSRRRLRFDEPLPRAAMHECALAATGQRYLIAIAVMHEEEQLSRSLTAALTAAEGLASVAVALDGRTRLQVDAIQAVVHRTNLEHASRGGITQAVSVVTCLDFMGPEPRNKGSALNRLISLLPDESGTERSGVCCANGAAPLRRPAADVLVTVDVDETLTRPGLLGLMTEMHTRPDVLCVQYEKYDAPWPGRPFSGAFAASYSSWFEHEATWTNTHTGVQHSSYYGSMAAIRLTTGLLEPEVHDLRNGSSVYGWRLFPTEHAVEDFPLFIEKLWESPPVFVPCRLGTGEAPLDARAYFKLWHRWAVGNLAVARRNGKSVLGSVGERPGRWQRVQVRHHVRSWAVLATAGLLPILTGLSVLRSPDFALLVSGVANLGIAALIARSVLLPVIGVGLMQRLVAVVAELLLAPVLIPTLVRTAIGKPESAPRSTPRVAGPTPGRVRVFAVVSLACTLGAMSRVITAAQPVSELLLVSLVPGLMLSLGEVLLLWYPERALRVRSADVAAG